MMNQNNENTLCTEETLEGVLQHGSVPVSRQAGRGRQSTTDGNQRRKFEYRDNVEVMRCYLESSPGKRGYRKRMHKLWKERGNANITEQRLADQLAQIKKKRWITQEEVENIRQSLMGEQIEEASHANTNEEQDLDGVSLTKVEMPLEIPNIQTLNEEDRKVRNELIEKIRESEDRESLPKIKNRHKELRNLIHRMNHIAETITTDSLEETNNLIYAIAKKTVELLDMRTTRVQKERSKPAWQMRIETKRRTLEREVGQLSRVNRDEMALPEKLRKKYRVGPNKDIAAAYEDSKQRLQAISQKIKRYTERQKQYQQNMLFKTNAKAFYRQLGKENTKTMNRVIWH